MAKTKTINHLSSSRKQAGRTEWLHPDIVGIHFAFKDFSKETLNLQKLLSTSSYKLFSFELKIKLDMAHLREYYFQAVSNSSWAHEGYLVVNELDFNDDLMDELRRLNNAFGIGLIELNAENFEQSKIVFFARHNDELDWLTIDQLAKLNKDFLDFLDDIDKDYKTTSIRGSYDEIYKEEFDVLSHGRYNGQIEVVDMTFNLFMELNATDEQLDFPIVYGIAKEGKCSLDLSQKN